MSAFHFEADENPGGDKPRDAVYASLETDPDEAMLAPPEDDDLDTIDGEDGSSSGGSDDDDDGDDDDDDNGDLLEPFPSRISHDRAPGTLGRNTYRKEEEEEDSTLRPGDHVYVWRSWGLPRAYQRHGMVLSTDPRNPEDATIVSFYHRDGRDREASDAQAANESEEWNDESLINEGSQSTRQQQKTTSGVRAESLFTFCKKAKIHKVSYGTKLAKRVLRRAGTITSCVSDERGLVVARVKHLLDNPNLLPEYHMMSANGECAAVWCKIGRWCTLQGSAILQIMVVGHAGGAAAGGIVASNVCLWTPMAGYFGSVGWWWYVPITVAYPVVVPLLVTFGLVSLVPLEVLRRFRKKWKKLSQELDTDFWAKTDEDVRQLYFASSVSTDADGIKKFFGAEKEDEEEKGKYMPLNAEGGMDSNDDGSDEQEMVKRYQEHMAMNGKNNSALDQENTAASLLNSVQGTMKKIKFPWTKRDSSVKKYMDQQHASNNNSEDGEQLMEAEQR